MANLSRGDQEIFVKHLLLSVRTDADTVARAFWRRRARNLYGLLRPRPVKSSKDGLPSSLELVWMPAWAFHIALVRGDWRSKIWVSVDASFGGFALFERTGALEEREPESEVMEPVLDRQACEKHARQGLLRYILRRRGRKPDIGTVEQAHRYYAPVWVYYFRRLRGKIDLAVRDGYTGDRMGGRMRIAVLNGFIRRQQGEPTSGTAS